MPFRRPTSPLHFEPLCPSPSDILLEESESDTDEESRAANRRRIEQIGEAYLAGEHPFILTASLRGPFGPSWKNPWRRKRDEIPNTTQKVPAVVPISSKQVNRTPQYDGPHTSSPVAVLNDPPEQFAFFDPANNLMSSRPGAEHTSQSEKYWLRRDDLYLRQQPDQKHRTPSPTPMSRPLSAKGLRSPHATSISPRSLKPVVYSPPEPSTAPPQSPSKLNSTVRAFLSPPKRPVSVSEPEKIDIVIDGTQSTPNTTNNGLEAFMQSRTRSTLQSGSSRPLESTKTIFNAASNKAIGNMKRREVPAVDLGIPRAHKRRSLRTVPPSTNLPAFEYRPTGAKRRKIGPLPLGLDRNAGEPSAPASKPVEFKKPTKRVSFHSSPTNPKATRKEQREIKDALRDSEINPPATAEELKKVQRTDILRVATSITSNTGFSPVSATPEVTADTGSTTHLPSAQIQPEDLLPPPVENLSTEPIDSEPLLLPPADEDPQEDSILQLSTQAAVARAQECFQADIITPLKSTSRPSALDTMHTPLEPNNPAPSKATETAEKQSTQALLDAMTPFNFSTAKRIKPATSTPCYPNTKVSNLKLQATRTHPTPLLPRKSSLSKMTSQTPSHLPSFPTKHLSLDMSTSPEPEPEHQPVSPSSPSSPSHYESAHSTSSRLPMPPPSATSTHTLPSQPSYQTSGLSYPPSTSNPLTGTANTSTTPHQDAQPQGDLVLDLGDMPYDLDETMEDIGSFLESWDVERDMRGSAVS
jgi:hypothetical protein